MTSPLNVPDITTKELTSQSALEANTLTLKLVGESDARNAAQMDALIRALHAEAVRLHPQEVVVDLRDLRFMNSSSFKAFVVWLGDMAALSPSEQYKVRFLSDKSKHWQARSLAALSSFAAELVRIES